MLRMAKPALKEISCNLKDRKDQAPEETNKTSIIEAPSLFESFTIDKRR